MSFANFNLRRPCTQCPFRCDIPGYLTDPRAREIAEHMTVTEQTFPCHKTTARPAKEWEHCAGALGFAVKLGLTFDHWLLRTAVGFGLYNPAALDHTMFHLLFESVREMEHHHARGGSGKWLLLTWLGSYADTPTECDGLTRVLHSILSLSAVPHEVWVGMLSAPDGRTAIAHWWIEIGPWMVDFRSMRWIGGEGVREGVFLKGDHAQRYRGQPIVIPPLPLSLFRVLTDGRLPSLVEPDTAREVLDEAWSQKEA